MKRAEAIRRARTDPANTSFASINTGRAVWWLDIPLEKISDLDVTEINLLLFDDRSDLLHHLRIPSDYLRTNMDRLDLRVVVGRAPHATTRKCVSLELAIDERRLFKNIRPVGSEVEFAQFRV